MDPGDPQTPIGSGAPKRVIERHIQKRHDITDAAMLEMHERGIFEMIDPPGREVVKAAWNPCSRIGRPAGKGEARIEPGHEGAEQYLHEDEHREQTRPNLEARYRCDAAARGADHLKRGPEDIAEQDHREAKMRGQTILTDRDAPPR